MQTGTGLAPILVGGLGVTLTIVGATFGLHQYRLGRHLQDAGFVTFEKGHEGRRPRTWAQITKAGRRAVAQEVKLLKVLVTQLEPETPPVVGSSFVR